MKFSRPEYRSELSSVTQSCPTPCDPMNCSMPGLPDNHQLPGSTQTHAHPVGDASKHLILCRPLLPLPPIPPSIRVFSNESTLHMRCPKYWSFSFSISPSKEHPGPISLRIDRLDLLAVQGTLKSLLRRPKRKDLSSIPPRMRAYDMGTQDVRVSYTVVASTSKPETCQALHGEPDPELRFI